MKHLLLLHGALGAKDQLQSLADALSKNYIIHRLNFSGHGGELMPEGSFSISLFAENVLNYMRQQNLLAVNIFGYSMGGYAGMYLAKNYPGKINKLVTLATKYQWDESIAAKEVKMLDAAAIQQKLPAFAAQLQQRHAPADWIKLLDKTKELLIQLGQNKVLKDEDYADIKTPCLLLAGDRDKMVTLDETIAVYKKLPAGQFGVLPDTHHPIEQVNTGMLAGFINRFI